MEETKQCPFCGQEIKATAKKCIHCGKWLEKKCPACGEWIKIDANKCRFCGEWQGDYEKWKYEKATGIKVDPVQQPVASVAGDDKKDEPTESLDDSNSGCILYAECMAIAALYTWYYDWAWWKGVLAYFLIAWFAAIRFTRIILCVVMCVLWAAFAYGFFDSGVAAGIVGVVALIIHTVVLQAQRRFLIFSQNE